MLASVPGTREHNKKKRRHPRNKNYQKKYFVQKQKKSEMRQDTNDTRRKNTYYKIRIC